MLVFMHRSVANLCDALVTTAATPIDQAFEDTPTTSANSTTSTNAQTAIESSVDDKGDTLLQVTLSFYFEY